jgi:hypothetical protein
MIPWHLVQVLLKGKHGDTPICNFLDTYVLSVDPWFIGDPPTLDEVVSAAALSFLGELLPLLSEWWEGDWIKARVVTGASVNPYRSLTRTYGEEGTLYLDGLQGLRGGKVAPDIVCLRAVKSWGSPPRRDVRANLYLSPVTVDSLEEDGAHFTDSFLATAQLSLTGVTSDLLFPDPSTGPWILRPCVWSGRAWVASGGSPSTVGDYIHDLTGLEPQRRVSSCVSRRGRLS